MKQENKSEIRRVLFRLKTTNMSVKLKAMEMVMNTSSQEVMEVALENLFDKLLKENPKIQEFL